jgi:hypothetical protein
MSVWNPQYSVNSSLFKFSLGAPVNMTLPSVSLAVYVVEFILLAFVAFGQKSHLLFCCYKFSAEGKKMKERFWNHLLLISCLVFCAFEIAAISAILGKLYYEVVWMEDSSWIVVSITLFDIHFGLFLIILMNVAKLTFTQTKKVEIGYRILVVSVGVLVMISIVMCLYGVLIVNLSHTYLRSLALYIYLPIMVITKSTLLVMFIIAGARIVYSVCKSDVGADMKWAAARIAFGMLIIILSTLLIVAGVVMVFSFLDGRVLLGLLLALTIPEMLFFLTVIILFFPYKWVKSLRNTKVEVQTE